MSGDVKRRKARAPIVRLVNFLNTHLPVQTKGSCPGYGVDNLEPNLGFTQFPWIDISVAHTNLSAIDALQQDLALFNSATAQPWEISMTGNHPAVGHATMQLRTMRTNICLSESVLKEFHRSANSLAEFLQQRFERKKLG